MQDCQWNFQSLSRVRRYSLLIEWYCWFVMCNIVKYILYARYIAPNAISAAMDPFLLRDEGGAKKILLISTTENLIEFMWISEVISFPCWLFSCRIKPRAPIDIFNYILVKHSFGLKPKCVYAFWPCDPECALSIPPQCKNQAVLLPLHFVSGRKFRL